MSTTASSREALPDLELCSDSSSSSDSAENSPVHFPEKGVSSPLSFDQTPEKDSLSNGPDVGAETSSVASESVGFTVRGLYTRYTPVEEEEADLESEFVLCRRRMKTRPIGNHSPRNQEESDNDQSDEAHSDGGMSDEDYETAMFEPVVGLVGTKFWHEEDEEAKVVREDRAILFQSQENYERLKSNDDFKGCYEGYDYMEWPTFGEQVIVNGCQTSDLSIGDIFEIEGGLSPLLIEITAPRKPCSYVNIKHGTAMGSKGIQTHVHHNCLAGWFARVLVAGELREGMRFTRKSHPNPKWTLTFINKALYGEGSRLQSMMNASSWNRDRAELEELVALPQLGEYEWKVEGRKRLLDFDGIDWKTVRRDSLDPQFDWEKWKLAHPEDALLTGNSSSSFLSLACMTDLLHTITEALKHFSMMG